MPFNYDELSLICRTLSEMSSSEWMKIIIRLNRTHELNQFLELINEEDLNPAANQISFNKVGKILIIGDSKLPKQHVEKTCKEYGIASQRLELVLEYSDNYDFKHIRYNHNYSLILVGPLPHKAKDANGSSSIINEILNSDGYPPVIKVTDSNNTLHISKNSLKEALSTAVNNGLVTVS